MRPRPLLILALAAGLLGFGLSTSISSRPSRPRGDEATFTLAALSLWHDHDLAWDERDLQRSFGLWTHGPSGLTLRMGEEGAGGCARFAVAPALPLAAAPWVGAFGAQGLRWLNGLLYLGMFVAAVWLASRTAPAEGARGSSAATVLWTGSFVASVSWLFVTRLSPAILLAACLFFPVAVGFFLRRRSESSPGRSPGRSPAGGEALLLAAAGLAAGAAIHSAPALALLTLPLAVDLVVRRRFGGLAVSVVCALAAVALLAGVGARWTGSAWPARGIEDGAVRVYWETFPGEVGEVGEGEPAGEAATAQQLSVASARSWAREVGWLAVGRYRGLAAWAPFALLALLLFFVSFFGGGPRDPLRTTLFVAALALGLLVIGLRAGGGGPAGAAFTGDGWLAAVCPVLVLLVPGQVFAGRWRKLAAAGLVAALLAAGLWTVPAIAAAAFTDRAEPLAALAGGPGAFRALPVELPLLPRLPGYALRPAGVATWVLPRHGFSVEEGHAHGVWMLGGTDAEVFVAAPQALDRLAFTAYSPLPQASLSAASGGDEVLVRFDSVGKRAGVPIALPAVPVGRDLGYFPRSSEDYVYRVVLKAEGGWVPARSDAGSADGRYLSVFLSFDGEGP